MPPPAPKIYAFVDESGQETAGALFLVAVVVTDHEYERINEILLDIEARSGKRGKKWSRARFEYRVAYIEAVIVHPLLRELAFFSRYTESQAYLELTVESTAKALRQRQPADAAVTVVVDGLRGRDVDRFKSRLRQWQINVRKVRGVRDESEPIVRLADAVAGFVRDFLEEQSYALPLYKKAVREKVIQAL